MKKKGKPKARPKTASAPQSNFWKGLVLGTALAGSAVYFLPRLTNQDSASGTAADSASATSDDEDVSDSTSRSGEKAHGSANSKPPKAKVVQNLAGSGAAKSKAPPAAVGSAAPPPSGPIAAASDTPPQRPVAGPKNSSVPTLFRTPINALDPALRLGLRDSYADSSQWKKTDNLGWNAFARLTTSSPVASNNGPVGNSVTCLLESKRPDEVENLLIVANVFNRQGEPETMEKFRELSRAYLSQTGCPVTREFIEAIGATGMETQTAAAAYSLKRIDIRPAYRWELSINAK
ncbi:MAG: hypothetical protein JWL81_1303 [Verrucomicrobiales bacterium]|nr:hypothetical protein [Verrucomicrobiales bacterium]